MTYLWENIKTKSSFRTTGPKRQDNCYCQTLLVGLIFIMKIYFIYSSQDTALFGVILRQTACLTYPDFKIDKSNIILISGCLLTCARVSSPLHRLPLLLLCQHHTQTLCRPVKQLSQMAAALLLLLM